VPSSWILFFCYELHTRDAILYNAQVWTVGNASDMRFADVLVGYGTGHVVFSGNSS